MSDTYHLDYETYSPQPLTGAKSVGAFKYAEDPTAEILIMAIAKNDEPVKVWDCVNGGQEALDLVAEAIDADAPIYAHNAQFEYAVSKYLFQKTFGMAPPAIEQWRCTAAMCRIAAIPSSLAQAGAFLKIDMPKDKEGARLIRKFCIPRHPTKEDYRTRIHPDEDLEDFQKFVDYCVRDVEAERQVHQKLHRYDLTGEFLESFQADMRMNDRGVPVNLKALERANQMMQEYYDRLVPLFREQVSMENHSIIFPVTAVRKKEKKVSIDDGFNPTQREMFVSWLKCFHNFTGTDLTGDTVNEWLANPRMLTEKAQKALYTYSLIQSAAVKKIPAMLKMACKDGYVRGALMVFGAERTHRWTGKGIQPQNYARPTIKHTELAYDAICKGFTIDAIEEIFGKFFDVLASCIRHFIQPHEGLVSQGDYSSIEARVAPWLVNEQKTLDMFTRGEPVYEMMASKIFGCSVEDVTQEQRFVGKQAVLGCSYNMGVPKFRGTCESYHYTPSQEMVDEYKKGKKQEHTDEEWLDLCYDDLAERAVTAWRKDNPLIVQSWRDLDDAAKNAIKIPNKIIPVGKMKLACLETKHTGIPGKTLCIKLPSGHYLQYPRARVVENKKRGWGEIIEFWGVIPNSGGKWGWCSTYGGKLLENATQGMAGDVMRHGMLRAEEAGYHPFMLVHDEMLSTQDKGQSHEEMCDLLCTEADWMKGLPLDAEGSTIPYYKK